MLIDVDRPFNPQIMEARSSTETEPEFIITFKLMTLFPLLRSQMSSMHCYLLQRLSYLP